MRPYLVQVESFQKEKFTQDNELGQHKPCEDVSETSATLNTKAEARRKGGVGVGCNFAEPSNSGVDLTRHMTTFNDGSGSRICQGSNPATMHWLHRQPAQPLIPKPECDHQIAADSDQTVLVVFG